MCLVCLFFDPEKALVIRRTKKVGIIKATSLFILDKKTERVFDTSRHIRNDRVDMPNVISVTS